MQGMGGLGCRGMGIGRRGMWGLECRGRGDQDAGNGVGEIIKEI